MRVICNSQVSLYRTRRLS